MHWLAALLRIFSRPKPKAPYPIDGHDDEFRNTITFYYRQELGRDPDPGGLESYLYACRYGMTGEQVRDSLHNSPEAIAYRNRPPAPEPVPVPVPTYDLESWPRRGASLYGLVGDPEWDYKEFGRILHDCGMTYTAWWCFGGWRNFDPAISRMPMTKRADGKFDLFAWNQRYFDDTAEIVRYMNSLGIVCEITILDLYPWSDRKQGLPGIQDAEPGPFRNNVNGVRWADDHTFDVLPDQWLTEFILRIVTTCKGLGVCYRVGNEMPEKPMHARIRDVIRQVDPLVPIMVNRNSDSPGQFANMNIGRDYDRISFHGWKNLARMDEVFHEEDGTGRPQTYRQLLSQLSANDRARIVACSDGARNGNPDPAHTYDWPELLEAFRFAVQQGCAVDHQSAAKMSLFTYGTHDLRTVETAFLQKLAAL